MSRAALIVAIAALVVSLAANVVAFTRTDTEIREGSVEFADLAPGTRAQLQGKPGKPGTRGPRGVRGPSGPPAIGIPGRPGKDAPDVSDRVNSLEEIVYDLCGVWIFVRDETTGETIRQKFC
jgi:hypothetical protein